MRGVNKVTLIGHLGKDPEVNRLEGGAVVAKFTLATSEPYNDKNGNRVDHAEWHNIVCWNKLGEIAEKYLKKGSLIYVDGKIRTRSYEKDGQKKYFTEIQANTFSMLDKKPEGATSGGTSMPANSSDAIGNEPTDDLPF